MATPHQFVIEQVFHCPVAEAFAFFSDYQTHFGKIWPGQFTRIRPGDDEQQPNGKGSIRKIDFGFRQFEETIVAYEPLQRIEYRISRNSPFQEYLGIMEFFALNEHETFFRHTMQLTPPLTRHPLAGKSRHKAGGTTRHPQGRTLAPAACC